MNNWTKRAVAGLVCVIFMSGLALIAFSQETIPENGLVAYWAFNEGSGNRSTDSSGKGHEVVLVGAAWEVGVMGTCLSFDGKDSYAQITDAPDLSMGEALTVMMWIKAKGPTEAFQNVLYKWGQHRNYGIFLGIMDGIYGFTTSLEGSLAKHTELYSSWSAWDDRWHHIAAVFDGNTKKVILYADGEVVCEQEVGYSAIKTNNQNIIIGSCFAGLTDEVMLYNRVLGKAEIANYYNFIKTK